MNPFSKLGASMEPKTRNKMQIKLVGDKLKVEIKANSALQSKMKIKLEHSFSC